jgi:hypothetical protein
MAEIERLTTDKIWVYDDPQECYDIATMIQERISGKVESVEDPRRRCVGFEMGNGVRVLYWLNFVTGNPKSKWYNPFTPLLMTSSSRAILAQCLTYMRGNLGCSMSRPNYSEYREDIARYRQRLPSVQQGKEDAPESI